DDLTWWTEWGDRGPRSPVRDPRLLAAVPDDAELLVWARSSSYVHAIAAGVSAAAAAHDEAVAAVGLDGMMVAVHGDRVALDAMRFDDVAGLARLSGARVGDLTTRRPAPEVAIAASAAWLDRGGGSELPVLLAGAPGDAIGAIVAQPSSAVLPID